MALNYKNSVTHMKLAVCVQIVILHTLQLILKCSFYLISAWSLVGLILTGFKIDMVFRSLMFQGKTGMNGLSLLPLRLGLFISTPTHLLLQPPNRKTLHGSIPDSRLSTL